MFINPCSNVMKRSVAEKRRMTTEGFPEKSQSFLLFTLAVGTTNQLETSGESSGTPHIQLRHQHM